MLVLSRERCEEVVITLPGHAPVVVTVVAIERGKVRLGFTAAAEVTVNRREIQDRIEAGLSRADALRGQS